MDPTTTFCPNVACPARGQTGQGNIGIHSRKEKRSRAGSATRTSKPDRARGNAADQGGDGHAGGISRNGCPLAGHRHRVWLRRAHRRKRAGRAGRPRTRVHQHLVEQPHTSAGTSHEIRVINRRHRGMTFATRTLAACGGGPAQRAGRQPLIRRHRAGEALCGPSSPVGLYGRLAGVHAGYS